MWNWCCILGEMCFVSYISHQNYNSQGEWRSDREVWHQGQGSHLKVTFQSTQQLLPIYLSARFTSLSPPLAASPALFWLSFAFLLFLILLPPPLPSPSIPRSGDVLTRQQGGSGVIKGSTNERLSGVNVLTYLCWTRGREVIYSKGTNCFTF